MISTRTIIVDLKITRNLITNFAELFNHTKHYHMILDEVLNHKMSLLKIDNPEGYENKLSSAVTNQINKKKVIISCISADGNGYKLK